jgi:REP element-mobilizing transposase RayT/DNA-binding response OmpR family regulator
MSVTLVIVTSAQDLGAQFRGLLKGSDYDPIATGDFSEAIKIVRKTNAAIVFLDVELEERGISILDVGYALLQINPALQFVILTRNGQVPELGSLSARAVMRKPITESDLRGVLNKLSHSAMPQPKPQTETMDDQNFNGNETIPWLRDVSKAAQQLTRLTLESSAQAALITRQNELWAYAGQLSREAAQELAQSIQRYWDKQTQSDLLRFIRLTATDAQHMLYATKLSSQMILALVFDAETPFSTIRTQAGKLAHSLSAPPEVEAPMRRAADPSPVMFLKTPIVDESMDEDEVNFPPIGDLLRDVPPPTPDFSKRATAPDLHAEKAARVNEPSQARNGAPPTYLVSSPSGFSRESSPALHMRRRDDQNAPDKRPHEPDTDTQMDETDMNATRKHVPADMAETRVSQNVIETRPQSLTEVAHRIVLEPVSPALYNLTYACLLVPRMDNHFLTGDVSDHLADWVPQICLAFGWRLEHLSIRPEYLQWIVNVPPSTSPGYLMRILRQQTSERLFTEFARFKKDNPSGDFWAPGYLIMGGSQPHPPKLVKDFIKQTRTRQGVGRNSTPRE